MSLTIGNLSESRELDANATAELKGGYWGEWVSTFVQSETTNIFQQNPLNVTIGAGAAGIVSMGNFSPMLLSAGSAMTWAQGLPFDL